MQNIASGIPVVPWQLKFFLMLWNLILSKLTLPQFITPSHQNFHHMMHRYCSKISMMYINSRNLNIQGREKKERWVNGKNNESYTHIHHPQLIPVNILVSFQSFFYIYIFYKWDGFSLNIMLASIFPCN